MTSGRLPRVFYRTAEAASFALLGVSGAGGQAGRSVGAGAAGADGADGADGDARGYQQKLGDLLEREALTSASFLSDGLQNAFALSGPPLEKPPVPPGDHFTVREFDHSIHQIEVRNRGDSPVLLESGQIFRGGAQDRVVLAPEIVKTGVGTLTVYCVEQGRWQTDGIDFSATGTLPDLLQYNLQARGDSEGVAVRQGQLWRAIQESLLGMGALGNTLNVSGWKSAGGALFAPAVDLPESPTGRGAVLLDSRIGLASFMLTPGPAFHSRLNSRLRDEQLWRRVFARNALAAREYFRLYDERRGVALRCTPDGRALRDLEGNYLLFHYSPEDLEGSFVPPLESPPDDLVRPLPDVGNFVDADAFISCLGECDVDMSGDAGARRFRVHHPERPIVGQGIVSEGRLMALQAFGLRAS